MTVGVTEHPPEVVKEQWAVVAYQHGWRDGCEAVNCFETEEEAVAYARDDWAASIGHNNQYEHEVAVLKVVRVFRGPRTWADL
jgi:hypothetical protein